jgi:hypothetical protein
VSVIVGVAGTVNVPGKTTVIVSPVVSAPLPLDVKPTVQVDRAPPVCGEPVNAMRVGAVAAAITTAAAGFEGVVSWLVATLNVFAASEPAAGSVSRESFSVAAVFLPSAHVPAPLASVTVAVVPVPVAVAEQFAKPVSSVTVGTAGTVKPLLKTIVIVSPAARLPPPPVLKPTVQSERAPPVWGLPVKLTRLTAGSIVYGSGREASSSSRSRNQPPVARRSDQVVPDGVTLRPARSKIATGAIARPVGRPRASRATEPSSLNFGSRVAVESLQLQVRSP